MAGRTYPISAIRHACEGITPRYVQHLRDRGLVLPSRPAGGRGLPAEYSKTEVVEIYLVYSTFNNECWDLLGQMLTAYRAWVAKPAAGKEKEVHISLSPILRVTVDFRQAHGHVSKKLQEWLSK